MLEDWCERRRDLGNHALEIRPREGQRRLTAGKAGAVRAAKSGWIFLDGAEQLGWIGWLEFRWLARNCRRVIIAVHALGRLPVVWDCTSSHGLLRDLVAGLGEECADVEALWTRSDGDIRVGLRELYDRAAAGSAATND